MYKANPMQANVMSYQEGKKAQTTKNADNVSNFDISNRNSHSGKPN